MIRETAEIRIKPDTDADFLAAVEQAVPLFRRADGCMSMHLERVVEMQGVYRLHVHWRTLEDHTVGFRQSEDFQAWRGLVGGFFAEPPKVDHSEVAVKGFTPIAN